ncbi:MAG: thioredoxin domain-containing protein [Deltaproteobacteria bacterium]|nr:thioredoxin domain-containing protein [Deltaproteobacteria bacterium]
MIKKSRRFLTPLLSATSIFVEYLYTRCVYACPTLKGYFLNVELEYVGIIFMIFIGFLSIMRKDDLVLLFLSLGVGAEIFLLGYQVYHGVYCVYCLIFGGILMLQFLMHYKKEKWKLIVCLIVIGLSVFGFLFKGGPAPSYAQTGQEKLISTFGEGKIIVRLYTDYFCGPCKALEPEVEPIIKELVSSNTIQLTFIDTPFFKYSALYARYFLYAINANKRSLDYAFSVRNALIEASNSKLDTPEKLESHLQSKGIKLNKFNPNPIFEVFTRYIREDKINSTPTCVILKEEKKEMYVGGKEIVDALKGLQKK